MKPDKLAEVISKEIDARMRPYMDGIFKIAEVDTVVDAGHYDLLIEGSTTVTPNIPVVAGVTAIATDMVLVINIGRSGANFLVIDVLR